MRNNKKHLSCLAFIKPREMNRHVYEGEKPSSRVETVTSPPAGRESGANLDDANNPENRRLAERFQKQFGEKIRGNELELRHNQNGVDYRYVFLMQDDNVTVSVTKINESERSERGANAPRPITRTVTYARLYADKVIGMPGLAAVMADGGTTSPRPAPRAPSAGAPVERVPSAATSSPSPAPRASNSTPNTPYAAQPVAPRPVEGTPPEEPQKPGRRVQVEIGGMIPRSGTDTTASGVNDWEKYGGAAKFTYVLTRPQNNVPYVAFTVPVSGQYGSSLNVSQNAGPWAVTDRTTYTGQLGAGLEAGIPIYGYVTPYVGAAVIAEGTRTENTNMSARGITEDTNFEVRPGVMLPVGVRVNPIEQWHLSVSAQPTRTFTAGGGWDIPVIVGTGLSF